jgi:hypothetical protein
MDGQILRLRFALDLRRETRSLSKARPLHTLGSPAYGDIT